MSEGEAKEEVKKALQAYVDAGQAWNKLMRSSSRYPSLFPDSDPMAGELQSRYNIPTETIPRPDSSGGPFRAMSRDVILSRIWAAARAHVERAATLIR
jgi:hypothetical protein